MNKQTGRARLNKPLSWQIFSVLLFSVISVGLITLLLNPAFAQTEKIRHLQQSVQSERTADYSVDEERAAVPLISISLVKDFLRDRLSVRDADSQFDAFLLSLQTLVPTVTPRAEVLVPVTGPLEPTLSLLLVFTQTPTADIFPSDTDTPEPSLTPTRTPWIVTYTWTPWPPGGPGSPPTATPSKTFTPTQTPTATATITLSPTLPPPPTETNTPLPPTPIATDTPVPPTQTPTDSATAIPADTLTPRPPTQMP